MLCSSTGYCCNFSIYGGADKKLAKFDKLPLDSKVLRQLLDIVENPENHDVYFDNYLKTLKQIKIRATGTVREKPYKEMSTVIVRCIEKENTLLLRL